jgi:hypothetical protein
VEGGIGNIIGLYLRSSVNRLRQGLRHFGVSSTVVAFRVFGPVLQTDAKCFLSLRCDKCDFVPESLLFSNEGKDFPSRVSVNSGTLPFRCMETLRANMSTACAQCPVKGGCT